MVFYTDLCDFGPQSVLWWKIWAEKLYEFNKKIIANGGFDDYYNGFGCKDLDKELPKLNMNFELKRCSKMLLTGLANSAE